MRFALRFCPLILLLALTPAVRGQGMLVPTDRGINPLAMVKHHVRAEITDQVAITTVEQTFRNHTNRPLEATYLFPVPKGANVNKFSMWIDGKETSGELLEAKQAEKIYTDIVRRTLDPGLLEYIDHSLMRMRVFPVPAHGEQRVKVSFTSILPQDGGVNEYTYPLRTDVKGLRTLEEVSFKATISTQQPIQTVYSPTHAITVHRDGDKKANVEFDRQQSLLDKDFQLFYATSNKDIGLTPLFYRPISSEDGYVMLMINPQVEAAKAVRVPRDLVMVLDTSGSMSEQKMDQARKALKYCLNQLDEKDRFAIIAFSTSVRHFRESLSECKSDDLDRARKWVDDLRTSGGTAIQPALEAALALRSNEPGRVSTIVFFTDGVPTVDETNPDKIVKHIIDKNSGKSRIFTFGVGDDVNASMLDRLADGTRGVSTYVRPAEDIEIKVSSLYAKINHPVMTDVKLSATNISLSEIYPPRLPDLFRGQQLVVIGRYSGQGGAAIKLTGLVGGVEKEIVYEISFPSKTVDGKAFVEDLWARRKVGYLLDQIRTNGESKELVAEVVKLAKRHGIATPYTSYLVIPDGPLPTIRAGVAGNMPVPAGPGAGAGFGGGGFGGGFGGGGIGGAVPPGLQGQSGYGGAMKPGSTETAPRTVADFAKGEAGKGAGIGQSRGAIQNQIVEEELKKIPADKRNGAYADALQRAKDQNQQYDAARKNYENRNLAGNQEGKLGVDLAEASNQLRSQDRMQRKASQIVNGRNCVEIGGVWIDDKFEAKTKTLAVKAQSDAYFRILKLQPKMRDVYHLGNYLVWVTPSGTALVVDQSNGKEQLDDKEIEALFASK
ncbi:MAG: VIT domain-containing protein [Gemmataceae bacterium]